MHCMCTSWESSALLSSADSNFAFQSLRPLLALFASWLCCEVGRWTVDINFPSGRPFAQGPLGSGWMTWRSSSNMSHVLKLHKSSLIQCGFSSFGARSLKQLEFLHIYITLLYNRFVLPLSQNHIKISIDITWLLRVQEVSHKVMLTHNEKGNVARVANLAT